MRPQAQERRRPDLIAIGIVPKIRIRRADSHRQLNLVLLLRREIVLPLRHPRRRRGRRGPHRRGRRCHRRRRGGAMIGSAGG